MFCKYCGSNIDNDSIFCSACGKNLGSFAPGSNIPQQNTQQQQVPEQNIPEQNAVCALILERKFDFQAMAQGIHVVLDGEEVAFLGSKGGSLAIPISSGTHEICAFVTQGKKTVSTLDAAPIHVSNHNLIVQFSIRRTAWSAYWQMEAVEDVNDATINIPLQ